MSDLFLKVGTKLDTSTIQTQLNGYKATLKVDTQLKTGEIKEKIKYVNEFGQSFETVNGQVTKVNSNLATSSTKIGQLGQDFVSTTGKVLKFGLSTAVIGAFTAGISEAVQAVKDIDSALTEFKKVSDLSDESLNNYVQTLGELGEKTGSTLSGMIEASTEFKKSGFNEQDSAQLASVAEMYRNIADEEIDAGQASSFIISQLKAFNMTVDESMHIIDAVNEVSNNYAVSSADLANNIGKISSTMATANNTYEETLG